MSMKKKSKVVEVVNQGKIEIKERDIPKLTPGDLLVKIEMAGYVEQTSILSMILHQMMQEQK